MNEDIIQTIDTFLKAHVEGLNYFAEDDTLQRAMEDARGGGEFLPLVYFRALPDPMDPSRVLVCFSYGTDTLEHELQAPARAQRCMDALCAAHPEVAATPLRVDLSGF